MKKIKCIILLVLASIPHSISIGQVEVTTSQSSHFPQIKSNMEAKKELKLATFAGGCFWCMQSEFNFEGINKSIVGYTGGNSAVKPNYELVSNGDSGHYEAILIQYNGSLVSYDKLLEIFFSNIDPTDNKGQFADRGSHYRPAIFFHNDKQRESANRFIEKLQKNFTKKIVVQVLPATEFFSAEEYHQDYYKKNPERYKMYKAYSGREEYIKANKDKLRINTDDSK